MVAFPLIDDSNYHILVPDENGQFEFNGPRLCLARPPKLALGAIPGTLAAEEFPDFIIPRSEWPDRIKQKDADKSWLEDIVRRKIATDDQNGLGFCHAYGTKIAGECCRLIQNQVYIYLSAESIGGPITRWRNIGADPEDDLQQFIAHGACPASYMNAPHSLSPTKWKAGWETVAMNYRPTEVWDMRSDTKAFDFAVTCALLGLATASGFSWWSHFVTGPYRVLHLGRNKFAVRYRNQWGPTFGDDGFVDFAEGKGTPDWAFCIRQMVLAA
jgi:hypothetical protein